DCCWRVSHDVVQGGRLVPLPPQGARRFAGRAGSVGGRWLVVRGEPLRWVRPRPRAPAAAPGRSNVGARAGRLRAVASNEGRLPVPRLGALQPETKRGRRRKKSRTRTH